MSPTYFELADHLAESLSEYLEIIERRKFIAAHVLASRSDLDHYADKAESADAAWHIAKRFVLADLTDEDEL